MAWRARTTTLCWSQLYSPSQGLWIWLLFSVYVPSCTVHCIYCTVYIYRIHYIPVLAKANRYHLNIGASNSLAEKRRAENWKLVTLCRVAISILFIPGIHCKKRFVIFPSPAGVSLTKLSVAGNDLVIPGQGEFGDIPAGDGKMTNLFLQCIYTSMWPQKWCQLYAGGRSPVNLRRLESLGNGNILRWVYRGCTAEATVLSRL